MVVRRRTGFRRGYWCESLMIKDFKDTDDPMNEGARIEEIIFDFQKLSM